MLAAATLFFANTYHLSLLPLDDCFYARKGVEMSQRGAIFSVTWNYLPNHQNPPLQFWLLGRNFALLGPNDFAARLPGALMALGILLIAYRIGTLTVGQRATLVGVGLLLVTNIFIQNARRCMLEIPTCFWICATMLLWLESLRRPRLSLLAGVSLAAGILTKSLLGLMPLLVLAGWLILPQLRGLRRSPWLWGGIVLGLVGGASWPVQQGLTQGWSVIHAHFFGEIGSRAAQGFEPLAVLLAYPRIMLTELQPVVLPGLIGVVLAARNWWRDRAERMILLVVWIVAPLALYSFSSARSARYVFPLLVPLALLGGWILIRWQQRASLLAVRWVVPGLLLTAAVIFWLSPGTLTRDSNAPFKQQGAQIAALVPAGRALPLYGSYEWSLANPLLYYGQRALGPGTESMATVLQQAHELEDPVFVTRRDRLSEVPASGQPLDRVMELGSWVIVRVPPAAGADAGRTGPPGGF